MSEIVEAIQPNEQNAPPPVDPPADPPTSPENDVVKRLQADLWKEKEKARLLNEQLENQKIADLQKKQKWEEIAQIRQTERDEYKQKYDGVIDSLVKDRKFSVLKQAGLKAGIKTEALPDLELLDFDEVTVEHSTTGKILVTGADQAIQNLKTLKPHWFNTRPASVNSISPEAFAAPPASGSVNLKMINDAETKWKKSGSKDDLRVYQDLIYKFKSQNQ